MTVSAVSGSSCSAPSRQNLKGRAERSTSGINEVSKARTTRGSGATHQSWRWSRCEWWFRSGSTERGRGPSSRVHGYPRGNQGYAEGQIGQLQSRAPLKQPETHKFSTSVVVVSCPPAAKPLASIPCRLSDGSAPTRRLGPVHLVMQAILVSNRRQL